MKTLILDYSKWRCGGNSARVSVGVGETALLNKEGYMCCLGQFSLQLNSELVPEDILNKGEPSELTKAVDDISCEYDGDLAPHIRNCPLSDQAIAINDNDETTPEEKIRLLRELFGREDYEIEVINQPQ